MPIVPEPFKTHLGYAQQRRDPIAAAALLQQALDRLQADARRQHRALAPDLHTVRTETGRPIELVPGVGAERGTWREARPLERARARLPQPVLPAVPHMHPIPEPQLQSEDCLLYTSPSPRDRTRSR